MKKTKMTDIVFLLDRSGSMSGMESDTIGGYNSYLKKVSKQNALVTTVLFDHEYEMINARKPINEIEELTNEKYFTRGSTALLDAIGNTINYLDQSHSEKVLFIITTDGYENASLKYNKNQIKEMIEGHANWEFMYLGADIDSFKEAASIGIKQSNTSNFEKSHHGMAKMFNCLSSVSEKYMETNEINSTWKESLEDYLQDNVNN